MSLPNVFRPEVQSTAVDAGLLLLRVWTGLSLLLLHGWSKLATYGTLVERFPDVLGIGSPAVNLALATFAEVAAAALIAIGLTTRLAAVMLVINFTVAWGVAHGARLSGPGSGELAFLYLAAFATVLLTGPGRFSLDAWIFGPASTRSRAVPAPDSQASSQPAR